MARVGRGQALPRTLTLPSGKFSTRSLRRYQVSGFQSKDFCRPLFSICQERAQFMNITQQHQLVALRDDSTSPIWRFSMARTSA
jgi:hypothetical protein